MHWTHFSEKEAVRKFIFSTYIAMRDIYYAI